MKDKDFKIISRQVNMIKTQDWDDFVIKVYKKPYCFQQQNGCRDRGVFHIKIPDTVIEDDYYHNNIPEIINGDEMGVKFQTWLNRDPKFSENGLNNWEIELFWHRNFYPDIQKIANDLLEKGEIEAGEYVINIDW